MTLGAEPPFTFEEMRGLRALLAQQKAKERASSDPLLERLTDNQIPVIFEGLDPPAERRGRASDPSPPEPVP